MSGFLERMICGGTGENGMRGRRSESEREAQRVKGNCTDCDREIDDCHGVVAEQKVEQ